MSAGGRKEEVALLTAPGMPEQGHYLRHLAPAVPHRGEPCSARTCGFPVAVVDVLRAKAPFRGVPAAHMANAKPSAAIQQTYKDLGRVRQGVGADHQASLRQAGSAGQLRLHAELHETPGRHGGVGERMVGCKYFSVVYGAVWQLFVKTDPPVSLQILGKTKNTSIGLFGSSLGFCSLPFTNQCSEGVPACVNGGAVIKTRPTEPLLARITRFRVWNNWQYVVCIG